MDERPLLAPDVELKRPTLGDASQPSFPLGTAGEKGWAVSESNEKWYSRSSAGNGKVGGERTIRSQKRKLGKRTMCYLPGTA
jgi:hypothetical protein